MNYELLENGDTHLHWHLFPRRNGDIENYDKIRIVGNAECWDGDEFYQYMVADDKIYKVYYNVQPDQELDVIDYTKAYKIVDITEVII